MHPIERANNPQWLLAIAGGASIIFGGLAILWPGLTLQLLIYLFGFNAIVFGLTELGQMLSPGERSLLWLGHLTVGLISLIAGLVALSLPDETAAGLLYVIAVWAIAIGVVETLGAFLLSQLYFAMGGLTLILLGLVLLANSAAGALALATIIGVFALVRGVLLLVVALRAPAAPAVGP